MTSKMVSVYLVTPYTLTTLTTAPDLTTFPSMPPALERYNKVEPSLAFLISEVREYTYTNGTMNNCPDYQSVLIGEVSYAKLFFLSHLVGNFGCPC